VVFWLLPTHYSSTESTCTGTVAKNPPPASSKREASVTPKLEDWVSCVQYFGHSETIVPDLVPHAGRRFKTMHLGETGCSYPYSVRESWDIRAGVERASEEEGVSVSAFEVRASKAGELRTVIDDFALGEEPESAV
jgi:hypothetical protein